LELVDVKKGVAVSQSPALPTTWRTPGVDEEQGDSAQANTLQPVSTRRMPELGKTSQTAVPALKGDSTKTGGGSILTPPAASESQLTADAKESNGTGKVAGMTSLDRNKTLLDELEAGAGSAKRESGDSRAKDETLEDKALSDKLAEHSGTAGKKGSVKKKGGAVDTASGTAGKKGSQASAVANEEGKQSDKEGEPAATDAAADARCGKRRSSGLDEVQEGRTKAEEITRKRRSEGGDDKTETNKSKGSDKSEKAESKTASKKEDAEAKLGKQGKEAAKGKGLKNKSAEAPNLQRGGGRNRSVPERLSPGGDTVLPVPSSNETTQSGSDNVKKHAEKGKGSEKDKAGKKRESGQTDAERGKTPKKPRKNKPQVFNVERILDRRVEKGM
jgi:hypothetical protein